MDERPVISLLEPERHLEIGRASGESVCADSFRGIALRDLETLLISSSDLVVRSAAALRRRGLEIYRTDLAVQLLDTPCRVATSAGSTDYVEMPSRPASS
jgi:hypothetical protein